MSYDYFNAHDRIQDIGDKLAKEFEVYEDLVDRFPRDKSFQMKLGEIFRAREAVSLRIDIIRFRISSGFMILYLL